MHKSFSITGYWKSDLIWMIIIQLDSEGAPSLCKGWCPSPFVSYRLAMVKNDPHTVHWFPMRVTYGQEMKLKIRLDTIGVECFLPMCYKTVETDDKVERRLVPAISNLIFIRSSQEVITGLKMFDPICSPLRYIIRESVIDDMREIMTVSDAAMDNFMRVAKVQDDSVFFLTPGEYLTNNVGKRVRVMSGPFAGVVGVIKRVRRNKHVVVQIDDIAVAAIEFVPNRYLVELE